MVRLLAMPLAVLAATAAIQPLPAPLKTQLKDGYWRAGCPVTLSQLRLLTVKTWGFDGKAHTGQLVVNEKAAAPLQRVFAKLYQLHFPIRHMQLSDAYVRSGSIPDTDITASFECRKASASPCTGKTSTGSWSNHAYGLAVDINPNENPYVGCGMTRDPARLTYVEPQEDAARDGHTRGRGCIPVDRLGLGWLLDRGHQGLHALLLERALASERRR